MSLATDEITRAAMTLPDRQRAALADALWDSLDDQADVNAAWTSEISSRVDDIVNGRVELLTREEVHARIAASLAARRR